MLLSDGDDVSVYRGREGTLGLRGVHGRPHLAPAALRVLRRTIPEGGCAMAASEWGMCQECQWWQIDPEAKPANTTMGLCIEEALQPFRLRVSGNSGCTHYTPGEPAHAAGSSAAPPTAEPQR
jgi:hypothetical protein